MGRLCRTCDFSVGYGGNCAEKYMPGIDPFNKHQLVTCRYYMAADKAFLDRALKMCQCQCKECKCKSEADDRVYED